MKKKDVIIIGIITLIYAVISFINLGAKENPQTFWCAENKGEYIELKLDEIKIHKVKFFGGTGAGKYTIYYSANGENFVYLKTITSNIFVWDEIETRWKFNYIRIVAESDKLYLGEIAFYDNENNLIDVNNISVSENAKVLFDEQDTIPEQISFMTNTYFDEAYHPNFAYKYINGIEFYDVHPPLGKLIIALGILMFDMTPFGYRLMGNIAGILMIPVIYIMAKDLFKDRKYAIFAAIIMACDNFHFAQTRMATLDSFLVLFIMLSYMFMYKYTCLDENTKLSKKLLLLFLSGLFMGMSIAVKWTGCFAAVGLAIIFFAKFIKGNVVESTECTKEEIKIKLKEKRWSMESTKTILSCILFFVIIPLTIYLVSYIPHKGADSLKEIWDIQTSALKFHIELKGNHHFASRWYTWFIMQKPVWHYDGNVGEGLTSTISGIGNPLIWWFGLLSMIYVFIKGFFKPRKEGLYLSLSILVAIIPYLWITREAFMYYYFPIIPFMMLCIVLLIKDIESKLKFKYIWVIFSVIFFVTFAYFYPISSGMTVTDEYVESTKWLDTWVY